MLLKSFLRLVFLRRKATLAQENAAMWCEVWANHIGGTMFFGFVMALGSSEYIKSWG